VGSWIRAGYSRLLGAKNITNAKSCMWHTKTVDEEDPTTVIWKEVIAVGRFLTFMKNLWFWFFKKN